MTLTDYIRRIVDGMPDGSAVTLPVSWLRDQVGREADANGKVGDLTCEEAAKTLGRSPSTVGEWCRAGDIRNAYRLKGREWRIPRSGLQEFLEGHGNSRPKTFHRGRETDLSEWRRVRK